MIITAIICIFIGFSVAYLIIPGSANENTAEAASSDQQYTCGMHPEIISDEPGICPICNMKLTPKRDASSDPGSVRINPAMKQNMGLVTKKADYQILTRRILTFGEVAVPDPKIHRVMLKTEGWVEKLYVDEGGQYVDKGEPLLEIYSPELVTAQKELLVATKSNSSEAMMRMAVASRKRLQNWDISNDQLRRLEETREVTRTLTVRSPADGFVRMKNVSEGERISARTVLYEITDLSEVWIEARVYEQDLSYIELNQPAGVSIPTLPGQSFAGYVTYISPFLDDRGQAEIRLALDNPEFKLKPSMYAEVEIQGELDDRRLVIDRSAVINSGARQLVFVADKNDSYSARTIRTGAVSGNDMIEVVDGLKAGEAVVTSGQFLLDSETRLGEVVETSDGHGHNHGDHAGSEDKMSAEENSQKSGDPYDVHTCPMPEHYHVLNYGPGQCPECGMDLVPVSETENSPVYVCPMPECGIATNEPGLCPVCNMHLTEYEPKKESASVEKTDSITGIHQHSDSSTHKKPAGNKADDDPYDIHTCPMPEHYHVLNYGPGQCHECGMDLVPVSETDNSPVYVCPMPECGIATNEPGLCPVCNMHLKEYQPEAKGDK